MNVTQRPFLRDDKLSQQANINGSDKQSIILVELRLIGQISPESNTTGGGKIKRDDPG